MSIFEFDEKLKTELRNRWLDYYEKNRSWIIAEGFNQSYKWTSDGYQCGRPSGAFIVGVITALEPKLTTLMPALCKFTSLDDVVIMLGLNFDSDVVIAQQYFQNMETEIERIKIVPLLSEEENGSHEKYLNKIREGNSI